MTATARRRPAFIPSLIYKDNRAALKWLQSAFGFEASEVLTDANGNIAHAEMSHGDGVIMIGNEFAEWTKSPVSIGGKNTQRIHVRLERGMDEHCERARQAGKNRHGARRSVLWRSYVYGHRSRRPSLDFRTVIQAPLQGGNGESKRPQV